MIRFNEPPKRQEVAELRSSLAMKEISPDRMSPEGAKSFWDDMFGEGPKSKQNEVSEDDIWAEIFGRDADEFRFDFKIDEGIRTVLDKLDVAQWGTLTEDERVEVIRQFVQVLADKLDLDAIPEVMFFDGPLNSLGEYSPTDNCVKLNAALLDHPDLLRDTIPHEMRHAYQHKRADVQETWMDLFYRINFDNYITPVYLSDHTCLFYLDYQNQLVEAEANAFAKLFA